MSESEKPIRIPRYDNFEPGSEHASKAKRSNRRIDTKPEVRLRLAVWKRGLRYRKNVRSLPGKPDLVFGPSKVVVFCDGDFWHGRDWEKLQEKLRRGSNPDYWLPKIARNRQRDAEHTAKLEADGWLVLRFWESAIKRDPGAIVATIEQAVRARRPRPASEN